MPTSLGFIVGNLRSGGRRRSSAVVPLVVAAVVFALVLAACTGSADLGEPDPAPTTQSSGADGDAASDGDDPDSGEAEEPARNPDAGPTNGDSDVMAILSELPGQLAIGDGTRLLVGRPDGQGQTEVDGGPDVLASQPTWSRSGRQLVWTSATADEQLSRVLEFDDDGVPVGEPLNSDSAGPPIFYYQWSPDDERLLYLRNSPAGAQVEAGWVAPGQDAVPVAVGSPFFASWAPGGETVAVHRNNFEIGVFDQFSAGVSGGDPEIAAPTASLPRTRGEFTAPAWVDESRMLVVSGGALVTAGLDSTGSSLEVLDELVAGVGSIRFVVSPDGSKVAYQRPADPGSEVIEAALPVQSQVGALVVLDVESGQEAVVTEDVAVAWEWSPDGTRLAWLEPDRSGQARWQFWSIDPAVGGDLPGNAQAPWIQLSRKYLNNYLPFFAQYTHSVTGWSPDSSAYVTAGSADGVGAIWMHLVDVDAPAVPVATGDFVTWGGGPTPPAGGAPIT